MSIDRNFIVVNGNNEVGDCLIFFEPFDDDETVEFISSDLTMIDILVMCNIFKSKNEAKKNYKGDTTLPIGFEMITIGKKKHQVTILNPIISKETK